MSCCPKCSGRLWFDKVDTEDYCGTCGWRAARLALPDERPVHTRSGRVKREGQIRSIRPRKVPS